MLDLVGLLLLGVEVGAEVEVVVHAEVFEVVLPYFVVGLIGPGEDVVILVFCVLLVDPLHPLLPDGPLHLILSLLKCEDSEFLIHKQPSRILLHQHSKGPAVSDIIVFVYSFYSYLLVFLVLNYLVLPAVL